MQSHFALQAANHHINIAAGRLIPFIVAKQFFASNRMHRLPTAHLKPVAPHPSAQPHDSPVRPNASHPPTASSRAQVLGLSGRPVLVSAGAGDTPLLWPLSTWLLKPDHVGARLGCSREFPCFALADPNRYPRLPTSKNRCVPARPDHPSVSTNNSQCRRLGS